MSIDWTPGPQDDENLNRNREGSEEGSQGLDFDAGETTEGEELAYDFEAAVTPANPDDNDGDDAPVAPSKSIVAIIMAQQPMQDLLKSASVSSVTENEVKKAVEQSTKVILDEYKAREKELNKAYDEASKAFIAAEKKRDETVTALKLVMKATQDDAVRAFEQASDRAEKACDIAQNAAFEELYAPNIHLIRQELDDQTPSIDGLVGEGLRLVVERDAVNFELAAAGQAVAERGNTARNLAVAPLNKQSAFVEQGLEADKDVAFALEKLDAAWNRHRNIEQAITILNVLQAKQTPTVDEVIEAHKSRINGEMQVDENFIPRIEQAIEARASLQAKLDEAFDVYVRNIDEAKAIFNKAMDESNSVYADGLNAVEAPVVEAQNAFDDVALERADVQANRQVWNKVFRFNKDQTLIETKPVKKYVDIVKGRLVRQLRGGTQPALRP